MPRSSCLLWLLGAMVAAGCQPAVSTPESVRPSAEVPSVDIVAPSESSLGVPVTKSSWTIEPGFAPLLFEEMTVFPADGSTLATWAVDGEEFLCTGKPKCYLHTKTAFGDGTLRFDYRFEPDPKITDSAKLAAHNTGVLLFIQEPHAIWPKSIEVQGKHSEMGQLRPNGGAVAVESQDSPAVREAARQPVGEWNSIEIVTQAGAITASINGQAVSVGQPGDLASGLIGLQAEGHRLRYRRLRFSPGKSSDWAAPASPTDD